MGFPGGRSPYPASGPYPIGYWSPWESGSGGGTTFSRVVVRSNDANVLVVPTTSDVYVFMRGLTADRTVTLPAAPATGQIVAVKDEDGSLAAHSIIIAGNGNTIDGAASYTMTAAQNGVKGSISLLFDGVAWGIV